MIVHAQEQSRIRNHNDISPEHLLLGLLDIDEGVAIEALAALAIGPQLMRQRIEEGMAPAKRRRPKSGHIPFTPQAKKALENALREALQLGHDYIGAEHILLGIMRGRDSIAAQTLLALGAEPDQLRVQVSMLVAEIGPSTLAAQVRSGGPPAPAPVQPAEMGQILASIDARLARIEGQLGIANPAARAGLGAPTEQPGQGLPPGEYAAPA